MTDDEWEAIQTEAVRQQREYVLARGSASGQMLSSADHHDYWIAKAAVQIAADEWQPIETAPRDGRKVLLWVPGYKASIMACWHVRSKSWISEGLCYSEDADAEVHVTHWRNLPKPPLGEKNGKHKRNS